MSTPLAERIRETLRKTIVDIIVNDEEIWDGIENVLQNDLETSRCYITFDGDPMIFVGLGSTEACQSYPIEIGIDQNEAKQGLISQIQGIDRLIADLNNNRSLLTEALKRYPAEEAKE